MSGLLHGSPDGIRPVVMFLTPREAATFLGLSIRTLARYRSKGHGPAYYKLGGSVRYTLEDLRQWAVMGSPSQESGRDGEPPDEVPREARSGQR